MTEHRLQGPLPEILAKGYHLAPVASNFESLYATDTYRAGVASLMVFGENYPSAPFTVADIRVDGLTLVATLDTGETLFTWDISQFVPLDHRVKVTVLDRAKLKYGILAYKPQADTEVSSIRELRSTDLNPNLDAQCSESLDGTRCQRPQGHLGNHQSIARDGLGYFYFSWSEGGAMKEWKVPYGWVTKCSYCGYSLCVANPNVAPTCSSCAYWLNQIERNKNRSIRIDGTHYMPGSGGYGGRVFHIKFDTGKEYHIGLWNQGKIPSQFRNDLPDNAVFLED